MNPDTKNIQLTTWERWLSNRNSFKLTCSMFKGKEIKEGDILRMRGKIIIGVLKTKQKRD